MTGGREECCVQVAVRVRPPNCRERAVEYIPGIFTDPESGRVSLNSEQESRHFTFDIVADEFISQEGFFNVVGFSLANSCFNGYNCCLLAYGQTGAGKTFTMEGGLEGGNKTTYSSEDRGMIPRIFQQVFKKMIEEIQSTEDVDFSVKVSYLQIYNEQIFDLFGSGSTSLSIREDSQKGIYVENLEEVPVSSADSALELFLEGSKKRNVASTAMNSGSSRSHSVFILNLESQRTGTAGNKNLRTSKLYLVDLAGSERQKLTEASGTRLKEASAINKSLSALGNVIQALADAGEGKYRHVPYRDSKLTFLLKDVLGGNSKCTLVANVSPSQICLEETISTLKFAQRAKLMQNFATLNEISSSMDPNSMISQIHQLKQEVALLKGNKQNEDLKGSLSETFDEVIQLRAKLTDAETRVKDLEGVVTSQNHLLSACYSYMKDYFKLRMKEGNIVECLHEMKQRTDISEEEMREAEDFLREEYRFLFKIQAEE